MTFRNTQLLLVVPLVVPLLAIISCGDSESGTLYVTGETTVGLDSIGGPGESATSNPGDSDDAETDDSTSGNPGTSNPGTSNPGSGGSNGVKFDVGEQPDLPAAETEGECSIPPHTPCDSNSNDPWHAIGINCPGEFQVVTNYMGDPAMQYVHTGQIGTYNPPTYPIHEGEKLVILSSGNAVDVVTPGSTGSTSIDGQDPGNLPGPMNPNGVGGQDCAQNPALVGTGDCSNTIAGQWSQGTGAYDYAEMRLIADVPEGVYGFSYDFIFFSTEYPVWYQTQYNDMYIAWLESELWTGNISFDEQGNPISLNAGFLDYKDADGNLDPECPCSAPELQGTGLEGHAATKWLTTTAGVNAGEQITLIFAIFDLSDNVLDSMIAIDNFEWQCEGGPPNTAPG